MISFIQIYNIKYHNKTVASFTKEKIDTDALR